MERAYRVDKTLALKDIWGIIWNLDDHLTYRKLHAGQTLSGDNIVKINASRASVSPSRLASKSSEPPAILGVNPNYFLSPAAFELLKSFEPSLSDALSAEFVHEETGKSYGRRTLLYLTDPIDCIDYENTEFGRGKGVEIGAQSSFRPKRGTRLILRSETIDRHIWRAAPPAANQVFVSDDLANAWKASGLRGWAFEACDVK